MVVWRLVDGVQKLDGPMGTELLARGVRTELPRWSASALDSHPDVVREIHRAYAAAGAEVHTANTFRTTPRSWGGGWQQVLTRAVVLAREGVPEGHRVAGSIAPLEDCYRPDRSPDDPLREHAQLAEALAEAGVDLILAETFPHAGEALAAVRGACLTGLPVWLAMTAGPNGDLMSPEEMRDCGRRAVDLGASALLVNCVPARLTLPFVLALTEVGVPVGAYANAGAVHDEVGWSNPESGSNDGPQRYLGYARTWLEAGAAIIGACCGTGPAHIRALNKVPE